LGVAQQAGRSAGEGFVPLLGDDGGEAGLDLGLHQQRGLVVAEIAQPGQHRRQPRDIAQLAGPALAVEMQHVTGVDRRAGVGGRHAGPPVAGVAREQPVGLRRAGIVADRCRSRWQAIEQPGARWCRDGRSPAPGGARPIGLAGVMSVGSRRMKHSPLSTTARMARAWSP
jgi:hypothetical protein